MGKRLSRRYEGILALVCCAAQRWHVEGRGNPLISVFAKHTRSCERRRRRGCGFDRNRMTLAVWGLDPDDVIRAFTASRCAEEVVGPAARSQDRQ